MDRLVPSSSTRENRTGTVAIAGGISQNQQPQPRSLTNCTIVTPSSRRSSVSSRSSSNGNILPDSLRKDTINCVMDGVIMWDMIDNLASLELLLHLHAEEAFAWDALEHEMQIRKVRIPTSFEPSELQSMSTKNKRNAVTNIKLVRDDLLHEWLSDGRGYSNGRRVEAEITTLNSKNLRHTTSPRVQWILRHIFYHFNLPVHTIPALWATFYTLIMDRVISAGKFIAQSTIWSNTMYLKEFDDVLQTDSFKTAINTKTPHGFQRFFYSSSDDSKHWKQNRHVLITSTFDFESSSDLDPSFRHITYAVSNVKSSNAEMNAKEIVDLLGIEAAVWYGGGCNNNANDAQAEIRSTFDFIMNKAEWNIDHTINELTHINGVKRRPTNFGDPFHWANLTVMHASKPFAGDTENGAHEQVHHRQCMMTMHSVHSDDAPYSQSVMDRLMGAGVVKVRTWRERQQRWLVNQRFARVVLTTMAMLTADNISCYVAWGMCFANTSPSQWKSRAGKEIATWLSMPLIVLGLHFESELGDYFEECYAWHNRPGPLYTRYTLWVPNDGSS